MNGIEPAGTVISEPDWEALLSEDGEIDAASRHWRTITSELADRQLLASVNGHSVQRLVCAYLTFDKMFGEVAKNGAVAKPRRGNSKAIARISPFFTAMREAGIDASALEAELGITPRRRGSVTKIDRKRHRKRASDEYLGKASG